MPCVLAQRFGLFVGRVVKPLLIHHVLYNQGGAVFGTKCAVAPLFLSQKKPSQFHLCILSLVVFPELWQCPCSAQKSLQGGVSLSCPEMGRLRFRVGCGHNLGLSG